MSNILAIVGRPNVGKSTLFNRLVGSKKAIVESESGITRDRHYGKSNWNGVEFSVIDTGGYVFGSEDVFEKEIRRQAEVAIQEANVIIFILDVTTGLTAMDADVAKILRRSNKKVFTVANKVDNNALRFEINEFYKLGLGELYSISAINGSGTGDLLDDVVKEFDADFKIEEPDTPKIAVVGRPNVGKSSLINVLLEEERNIVTEIAGTTRDSLYTEFKKYGYDFTLVDTAGLRRKAKVNDDVEFYSNIRSIKAIENSDVCLLMLDAENGIEAQDLAIISLLNKNNKGLVVCVNKWDLLEKETNTMKEYKNGILKRLEPDNDVPIVFVSVLNKQRVFKALDALIQVYENRKRQISTSKFNEYILDVIERNNPPALKGKYIQIKYAHQIKTPYPTFVFYCNLPQYIREPYKRFLENKIREKWDFSGAPMRLFFRKK
jgi:GTP-binding protein